MLVNDWGGGQQLEDDGKALATNAKAEIITSENIFIDNNDKAGPSTLEKGKTVNSNMENQMENALDETLIESQKSDSKTEMETGNPVFDNNDSGMGEIPSTLDEGKTGNVKRKRI